jgi:nucleotide-binding universal stress UspA family protein
MVRTMRKILVAIDGSDNALRALGFAAAEARARDDTMLHLLTVMPPLRVYGEIDVYAGEERMRELAMREARAVLDAAAARLSGAGVEFDVEQSEGDPGEVIPHRAAELGCDWIVMGTHGRGRLGALLMGSVAQKVVHLTTLPVTLVK